MQHVSRSCIGRASDAYSTRATKNGKVLIGLYIRRDLDAVGLGRIGGAGDAVGSWSGDGLCGESVGSSGRSSVVLIDIGGMG